MSAKRKERKEAIARKFQALSPQRKRAMLHNIIGAQLPEILGSEELLLDVSDQLSPEMRRGLLGRVAYDVTAKWLRGRK